MQAHISMQILHILRFLMTVGAAVSISKRKGQRIQRARVDVSEQGIDEENVGG